MNCRTEGPEPGSSKPMLQSLFGRECDEPNEVMVPVNMLKILYKILK